MSLLKILENIGRRAGGKTFSGHEPMTLAAAVLKDWPKGFHALLDKLGSQPIFAGRGLRVKYLSFYQSLFKNKGIGTNMDFLRDEFIAYGVDHADESLVSERMKGVDKHARRYVSVSELAKRLGVERSTARGWVVKGLVPFKNANAPGKPQRFVVDTEGLDLQARSPADVLGERDAAKYIGLSAGLLRAMRQIGNYSPDSVTNQRRGFWKIDLDRLANRFNSLTCSNRKSFGATISL
ncbi:helix-turn-helix domain-containing protein, partial [Roseateles sp. P5_E11]